MPGENDVHILAETGKDNGLTPITLELIGLGAGLSADLGGALHAIILGEGIGEASRELASLGASEVRAADDPSLAEYNPDVYLGVLKDLLKKGTLLAGHTAIGQDLLPRLAFVLEAGLVTDCVGIQAGDLEGGPVFVKPIFGGNALASIRVSSDIKMATVRARVGKAPPASGDGGEIVQVDVEQVEPRIKVTDRVTEKRGIQLEDAPVIVSGGRGIGGADGFEQLGELAELLGGTVGASRPPVDSGWFPSTGQVGITGKIVAPDLYIAIGISGSSQHLSGMSESEKIVAINQDPEAYIFKVSDFGAVGDWKQVLPSFTAKLKELKG